MGRYRKIGLAVMIVGVAAGSVFTNMTYQADYYFLADLNMDISNIKVMDEAHMAHYVIYILGKRFFQLLLLVLLTHLFVAEALIVAAGFAGSFVFSVFLTYQLLQSGIAGVGQVLLAMCPQWFFYGAAVCWLMKRGRLRGGQERFWYYLMLAVFVLGGLISEIFLNPRLLTL